MKHQHKRNHPVWTSIVLFLLLAALQYLLGFVTVSQNHYGMIFYAAILVAYAIYLIFIVLLYFTGSYMQWINHQDWIAGILKGYSVLFVFGFMLSFLLPGWNNGALMGWDSTFGGYSRALLIASIDYFMIGLSIAFPVSLYSLFLANKSLLVAHRKHQTFAYGIILLVLSCILLWKSYPPFLLVLRTWFVGG